MLKTKIDELHQEYNKFFMGLEKVPPAQQRQNLERLHNKLKTEVAKQNNGALKFQFQSVSARFMTYRNLWDKQMPK